MLHLDRERAASFGADATAYDRSRPSYPHALIADLVAGTMKRVLDVGCGTGKVARLFVAVGCDVLGVEADPRMAEVAIRHGLDVVETRFEDFDPAGRCFDLVVSGHAWHWVDPIVGPVKAAHLLTGEGTLAVFSNYGRPADTELMAGFREIYREIAPQLFDQTIALGCYDVNAETRLHVDSIEASGCFSSCTVSSYPWTQRYSPGAWLSLLRTYSDHALLDATTRSALFDRLSGLLDGLDHDVLVDYSAICVKASGPLPPGRIVPRTLSRTGDEPEA